VQEVVEITVLSTGRPFVEEDGRPTAFGMVVCEHVDKIGFFEPSVEVVEKELLCDGIRFALRIGDGLQKPLGEIVRGFKIGCFRIAREYGLVAADDARPIFKPDFEMLTKVAVRPLLV